MAGERNRGHACRQGKPGQVCEERRDAESSGAFIEGRCDDVLPEPSRPKKVRRAPRAEAGGAFGACLAPAFDHMSPFGNEGRRNYAGIGAKSGPSLAEHRAPRPMFA